MSFKKENAGNNNALSAIEQIGDYMPGNSFISKAREDDRYRNERYIADNFEKALDNHWFKVYYQPILRVKNRKITALEALARWADPEYGIISPVDFIPVLSRMHKLYLLDLYMIEEVCREFSIRDEAGLPLIPVSVNISAQDFDYVDIPGSLKEITEKHGLKPENIIVEITEQDIAEGAEHFREALNQIRDFGFRLWIDDFGSGYSSLNVLGQYDVDRIKFDMELIRHLEDHNGVNRRILEAMVGVCRDIGVKTLAEGVETESQLRFLEEIDCDMMQGFYFFKPDPVEVSIDNFRNRFDELLTETKEDREKLLRLREKEESTDESESGNWIARMDNRLKERYNLNLGTIITSVASMLAIIGVSIFVGIQIHAMEREILQNKGELIAKESASEYDLYLMNRTDIMTRAGNNVDMMIDAGEGGAGQADNKEILAYLTAETDYILNVLGEETTGLYGWINGEYLDGVGWVPDEDFVATERPWYKQAVASGRKITFVEPYLDAHTRTVMMTIAELLSDGESVVAIDISLDHIQEIVEQLAASTEGSQALILDSNGVVVAHSDNKQLGLNYFEEEGLGHDVAVRILEEGLKAFEVDSGEENYTAYVEELEGGWFSVSLINTNVWHRPIHRAMIIFAAILSAVLVSIIVVFFRFTSRDRALIQLHTRIDEEERRGEELQALSETDRMTGLNDRVSGERKVNEIARGGMFIELDIDNFKSVNDRFGHRKGDEVILAVADALKNTFRSYDVTMRLGGDEFGAFAVGITDCRTGEMIIERLFRRIEKIDVLDEPVCISVGAVINPGAENFDRLYSKADDALYESKKETGNFVTWRIEE